MIFKILTALTLAFCTSSSVYADGKAVTPAVKKEEKTLDFSRSKVSEKKHFLVTFIPSVDPIPAEKVHEWNFAIKDAAGKAVNHAEIISVMGLMPEHEHEFGAKPVIKRPSGPGIVKVENLKFVMSGVWNVTVKIRDGKTEDTVVFNVKI